MSERITWEDAVKEDVWRAGAGKYGGLITALKRIESQYGIDANHFVRMIGGEGLENADIGPRIMEWWNGFFRSLKESESTKVSVSVEENVGQGFSRKLGGPVGAVQLDNLEFSFPGHSDEMSHTELIVKGERFPEGLVVASSNRDGKWLRTVSYINPKTGEEKIYSSYKDYYFEEAEEKFRATE